jgi:hypothetical protein
VLLNTKEVEAPAAPQATEAAQKLPELLEEMQVAAKIRIVRL